MQEMSAIAAVFMVVAGAVVLAWPLVRRAGRGLQAAQAAVRPARLWPTLRAAHSASVASAAVTVPALRPASALPDRMTREVQWDRATAVVTDAIARVEGVHELQRSAEQQLDSATYAIQRLFAELSGIMQISPLADPGSDAQVVHQFAVATPRRERSAAMAA